MPTKVVQGILVDLKVLGQSLQGHIISDTRFFMTMPSYTYLYLLDHAGMHLLVFT